MSECTHNCSSCSQECSSRTKESLLAPENKNSKVKNIIAVVSGKGGVGKSLVTSLLAVSSSRKGYKTAVVDADITGPSIPRIFGLSKAVIEGNDDGMFPAITQSGIKAISLNMLLDDETTPVIWRGPVIAGTVKQFWTEVQWGENDYMFIDCPPGTGDVPLTVFQSIPVSGIVIVTSPQELVSMIVSKAAKMAEMMNIPVLGIVENMSYIECPDCKKRISVFGESHLEEIAEKFGYDILGRIPIDSEIAALCDKGEIENVKKEYLSEAFNTINSKLCEKKQ